MRFAAVAITCLLAGAGTLGWGSAVAAAHDGATDDDEVAFETLGVVSSSSGINLLEGSILTVRGGGEVDVARDILATGHDDAFTREVVDLIGEIPADRVVLIGAIDSSCTPAKKAGLRRDPNGELAMTAVGHVPEPIECFVAVVTVAVLSVDAADAPVGSGDGAALVHFQLTDVAEPTAIEITDDDDLLLDVLPDGSDVPDLPPRDAGDRRFGFVRAGCANTTAEMIVTPQLLDARLGNDEHGPAMACVRAEYFLAVFDVPADLVRGTAVLVEA